MYIIDDEYLGFGIFSSGPSVCISCPTLTILIQVLKSKEKMIGVKCTSCYKVTVHSCNKKSMQRQ